MLKMEYVIRIFFFDPEIFMNRVTFEPYSEKSRKLQDPTSPL